MMRVLFYAARGPPVRGPAQQGRGGWLSSPIQKLPHGSAAGPGPVIKQGGLTLRMAERS